VAEGAVTSSTGNHGQGVAFAARLLGRTADIFLPDGCVAAKLKALDRLGARLHLGGRDIDEAKERGIAFARERGLPFIDDGESPHVIAGAGTVGLEIGRRLPAADLVLAPMGSGSLAAGTALGLKATRAAARVVAVQPAGAPAMVESFHARQPIERPCATVADCLVQRVPPKLSLAAILALVEDALLVTETEILRAMRTVLAEANLLVEPGSAASLAAAWQRRADLGGRTVVLLLTGNNLDLAVLDRARTLPVLGEA
jgi:threonine dehydratase